MDVVVPSMSHTTTLMPAAGAATAVAPTEETILYATAALAAAVAALMMTMIVCVCVEPVDTFRTHTCARYLTTLGTHTRRKLLWHCVSVCCVCAHSVHGLCVCDLRVYREPAILNWGGRAVFGR